MKEGRYKFCKKPALPHGVKNLSAIDSAWDSCSHETDHTDTHIQLLWCPGDTENSGLTGPELNVLVLVHAVLPSIL